MRAAVRPVEWTLLAALALGAGAGCTATVDVYSTPDPTDPTEPIAPTEPSDPTTVPTSRPMCGLDGDGSHAALALLSNQDVVFVRGDGSREVVFSFAEMATGTISAQLVSRGGRLAVAASGQLSDGTYAGHVVVLGLDGAVVFDQVIPEGAYTVFVSEAGQSLFTRGWADTLVVNADGSSETLQGITPVGAADASGAFPVLLTPNAYVMRYGLYVPGQGTVGGEDSLSSAIGFDGGFVSLISFEAPELLRRTSAGVDSVAMSTDWATTWLWPTASTRHGDVVVQSTEYLEDGTTEQTTLRWRRDADAPATLELPSGQSLFGTGFYTGPALSETGAVVAAARTSDTGAVLVDNGDGFVPVGPTFRDVWDVHLTVGGGTVIAVGSDEPGYFPMDPWQAGEAERSGPFGFVTRLNGEHLAEFPTTATGILLDAGGGCAVYVDEGALEVLDVDGESTQSLGAVPEGWSLGPQSVAWL
ncbi:MAG: hypothetical protein U0271_45860 [Polyangiaceae bacterium]